MGSPVSPIVANLYMAFFKDNGLRTSQTLSRLWKRYVEDTSIIQHKEHKRNFLQYINSIDSAIKFTVEDTRPHDSMPFLDTLVIPEHNGHSAPWYTESQLIWINTYNATPTIT